MDCLALDVAYTAVIARFKSLILSFFERASNINSTYLPYIPFQLMSSFLSLLMLSETI